MASVGGLSEGGRACANTWGDGMQFKNSWVAWGTFSPAVCGGVAAGGADELRHGVCGSLACVVGLGRGRCAWEGEGTPRGVACRLRIRVSFGAEMHRRFQSPLAVGGATESRHHGWRLACVIGLGPRAVWGEACANT